MDTKIKFEAAVKPALQSLGIDISTWLALLQAVLDALATNCASNDPEVVARSLQHPNVFTRRRVKVAVMKYLNTVGVPQTKHYMVTDAVLEFCKRDLTLTELTGEVIAARIQRGMANASEDGE